MDRRRALPVVPTGVSVRTVPKIVELSVAVGELVHDGRTVALEGTGRLAPYAAAHEIIRQRRRDLTLVRTTADALADRLVGAGCVGTLVFARADGPGDRPLPRLRDALARQWPRPVGTEEHTSPAMAARYTAAASGVPFTTVRDTGTDLAHHTHTSATVRCPFTGAIVTAVAALAPDVAIVHAQRADRTGNVAFAAPLGVRRDALLAARAAVVTVDEIVDDLDPAPGALVLPAAFLAAVAVVPSEAADPEDGTEDRADRYDVVGWPDIASDRERFATWLDALDETP